MMWLNDIMRMYVFEVYLSEKLLNNFLYQIRTILEALNEHMTSCLLSKKHLVINALTAKCRYT
jgi:hypothetical protein